MISGVTGFGVFVELSDIYIEGLVHITALKNDYYQFDAAGHRLLGERTRKVYRLGDKVSVKVVRVNLDDKKIDFAGVCGAAAQGSSTANVQAAALILESTNNVLKDLLSQ